jgi:hypothetical protein
MLMGCNFNNVNADREVKFDERRKEGRVGMESRGENDVRSSSSGPWTAMWFWLRDRAILIAWNGVPTPESLRSSHKKTNKQNDISTRPSVEKNGNENDSEKENKRMKRMKRH